MFKFLFSLGAEETEFSWQNITFLVGSAPRGDLLMQTQIKSLLTFYCLILTQSFGISVL